MALFDAWGVWEGADLGATGERRELFIYCYAPPRLQSSRQRMFCCKRGRFPVKTLGGPGALSGCLIRASDVADGVNIRNLFYVQHPF